MYFFVIKYQVIYYKIDNKIKPMCRTKADFEKKIGRIFSVYEFLATARKYDQLINFFSERVKQIYKRKVLLFALHFFYYETRGKSEK